MSHSFWADILMQRISYKRLLSKLYNVYPQISFVRTWLIKVSTHMAYNYLRNKKIEKNKYENMVESESSNIVLIEDMAIMNIEVKMIRKILDS